MSKGIILSTGIFVTVDNEDYDYLNQFKWYLSNGYAISAGNKSKIGLKGRTKMHRLILNAQNGQLVDHRDRNRLNNVKSNLRIVDKEGNVHNQQKRINTNNNYKGTQFIKRLKAWQSRCRIYGNDYFLGHYKSEIAAAYAYNKKASELSTCILLNNIGISNQEAEKLLVSDSVKLKPADKRSGQKGVYWNKWKNKWQVVLIKNNCRFNLGTFIYETDAILAYKTFHESQFPCGTFINKNIFKIISK